ncbi:LAME_0E09340g1_1 [Lachancea meyersii CBS 8951]|uniref:LAME_0E09340g1_1 n=1 Tax=Lachancea meyersii CBS 8951 TaxID=1266667 RepID=A0A1G4JJD7_9SACH|nr:LAME_0E09340g1_1 [Lachancea meyersii CBS 8951]
MGLERESSTPSLVGFSVRGIDDSNNPDFCDDRRPTVADARSSPQLLEKIHSSSQLNKLEGPYTSVEELNREGALLTDDNEVDLDSVVHGKLGDAEDLKKSLLRKKKKQQQHHHNHHQHQHHGLQVPRGVSSSSSSSMSPSASSSHSPSQTRSSSLVTSTDPVHHSHAGGGAGARATGNFALNDDDEQIRNSYGEFIANRSHRPHLAGGESYQSTNSYESEDSSRERSGRSARKEEASRDYLRSLSRSLSRDPRKSIEHELSRVHLKPDVEASSHVITEEIEESNEQAGQDQEDQGALLNDERDEDYSVELQQAANHEEDKLPEQ